MSRHFSIYIVSPNGYPHSRCFEEVAIALKAAFAALRYDAPIVTEPQYIEGQAVVLGANLLPAIRESLPRNLILFNMEQIQEGTVWMKNGYHLLLHRYPVWDYSHRNIAKLREMGIKATHCGIGYMPDLTRIKPAAREDIDVLFVGSINQRRRAVIDGIARHGYRAVGAFNLYGESRDNLIARAKIVLNMHYSEAKIFEIVRVSYLLANRKCVVSERGLDDALEAPFHAGIAFESYFRLVDTCVKLLENYEERQHLADAGFACFSKRSQVELLRAALASLTQ